jgi:hypothetical protein
MLKEDGLLKEQIHDTTGSGSYFALVVVVCLGSYYYLYGNNSGFI